MLLDLVMLILPIKKYGVRDFAIGGRQSARETAVRVAAGAIAKKILHEEYGIKITGFMTQLGKIKIPFVSFKHINQNPFFFFLGRTSHSRRKKRILVYVFK